MGTFDSIRNQVMAIGNPDVKETFISLIDILDPTTDIEEVPGMAPVVGVDIAPTALSNNPAPIITPPIPDVVMAPPVMTDSAGAVVPDAIPDTVPGFTTPDRPANPITGE